MYSCQCLCYWSPTYDTGMSTCQCHPANIRLASSAAPCTLHVMLPELPDAWRALVGQEWKAAALDPLRAFIANEYETQTIYPPVDLVFTALRLTPPESVKAVILGQDPYHGAGQAHGLA